MGGYGVVLLVDDDERWLEACERGFRGLGSTVHATTNVAGARALAAAHPPELVVMDIRLGGESGIELIEPLRQAHPGCTIVMVSAYLSVALTAAALRKGAHLVLFKPVHPTEIVRQLPQAVSQAVPQAMPQAMSQAPGQAMSQAPAPADAAATSHAWVTPTLARAEWEHINRVLMDCNGNVSEAARRLGILRQSLQRRLRKHAPPH